MIIVRFMIDSRPPSSGRSAPAPRPPAPSAPRRLRSQDLFGGGREVRIEHDGVEYRLRRTRHEKLILTK